VENWTEVVEENGISSHSKQEVEQLGLEKEDLTIRLQRAEEQAAENLKNWEDANAKFTEALTKTIGDTRKEYTSFIDPADKKSLEAAAAKKLGMVTKKAAKKITEGYQKLEGEKAQLEGKKQELEKEKKQLKDDNQELENKKTQLEGEKQKLVVDLKE
jgi:hypothetical protein